jgi:hypothetical protein
MVDLYCVSYSKPPVAVKAVPTPTRKVAIVKMARGAEGSDRGRATARANANTDGVTLRSTLCVTGVLATRLDSFVVAGKPDPELDQIAAVARAERGALLSTADYQAVDEIGMS